MGYRGKVELKEKARLMRAEGRTLHDIATTLGVAKSSVSLWVRDVPFEPGHRQAIAATAAPTHSTSPSSRQIEELRPARRRAHRHPVRRSVPRRRRRAVRRRGREERRPGAVREHRSRRWSRSSARGCVASSRSTSRGCASASICTRASISTRPSAFWSDVDRRPARSVSTRRTARSRDPTIRTNEARARLRVRRLLAARGRTERSWASSGRCYPRAPFRGSSIGRAADC